MPRPWAATQHKTENSVILTLVLSLLNSFYGRASLSPFVPLTCPNQEGFAGVVAGAGECAASTSGWRGRHVCTCADLSVTRNVFMLGATIETLAVAARPSMAPVSAL